MSGRPSVRYLTVAECAALLGVGHKTIRRRIDQGELPASRVGRLLRIAPADLEALRFRPADSDPGRRRRGPAPVRPCISTGFRSLR